MAGVAVEVEVEVEVVSPCWRACVVEEVEVACSILRLSFRVHGAPAVLVGGPVCVCEVQRGDYPLAVLPDCYRTATGTFEVSEVCDH